MPEEEGIQEVVNNEVVEETTPSDSTTDGNNSPESTEELTPAFSDDDSSESGESEENEEDPDKPQTRAEKRSQQLDSEIEELEQKLNPNVEIREKVARRNELREQIEAQNAEVYKTPELPSVDDLLEQVNPETGDYYTRQEARMELLEQRERVREYEGQVRQYNEQVAENLYTLEAETQAVLRDFPMFDQNSPDFNKEVADGVARILDKSLQYDQQTGKLIGSNLSVYDLYKSHAVAAQASARKSKIEGQKATERMLSQSDRVTGGQGRQKSFDQMTLAQKRDYLRRKGHDI